MPFIANLVAPQAGIAMEESSLNFLGAGNGTNQSVTIYFFYGSGCPHCALVQPLIESLAKKYPQTTLQELEVNYNNANRVLFQDFNARFNITAPTVPSVQVGDQGLVGEDAIKADLESAIQHAISDQTNVPAGDGGVAPSTNESSTSNNSTPTPTNSSSALPSNNPQRSTALTVTMVVVAAAADSINPCAISVMIFLLIFMTSLGNKKRVLQVGMAYVVTVYIVYFLAGLGILAFLQSMAITRTVYYVAAAVSIVFGLINIKDFFFSKKATLAIPESRKPMIKKYIAKASIPAAIVLGFAVSMFELPCTGGIYFAILTLLGNEMTMMQGLPYLALYNLIYVLPLAIILVIVYFGVSAEKANSWRLENRKSLRLALGLIMVAIGAVMILQVMSLDSVVSVARSLIVQVWGIVQRHPDLTIWSIFALELLLVGAYWFRKRKKKGEKVQRNVLDFSLLKEQMEKVGIVLDTIRCPGCGGSVSLPSSGATATCQHCGNTVQAIDVFEKMKGSFAGYGEELGG